MTDFMAGEPIPTCQVQVWSVLVAVFVVVELSLVGAFWQEFRLPKTQADCPGYELRVVHYDSRP